MSASSSSNSTIDFETDLRNALIAASRLSADAIDQIYEAMQVQNITFQQAAVDLGFVTSSEMEQAMERAQGLSEAGLVETAIRRISSDRRIVLRQGERVRPGERLLLAHDQYSPRSERIRALRTELLLLNEPGRGANTVTILSACDGEGRSQIAAELAISFAQLGRRTLLVDADLRKPEQHVLFGSSNEHGVSVSIAHNERPYFHPVTGLPHMDLLTAGPVATNPLELLSDGRFERQLTDWRNNYEFVVLDTPPVSKYADGLAIATMAGRVLVLSRAQHTSFANTREMLRRLATTQAKILGAVLNHF